jgi:ABC-2 type transport system ATP-binding protein
MSIVVEGVTKIYGKQKALDDVSLEITPGEVAGLLGPNGAGKSTLMKIITCFIPPTEGSVKVSGFSIHEGSLEVRKKVGYLPENNPLYLDMYVKEYLMFIAGIHKLENRKGKVDEMIATTGLEIEQKKKIGALSKGYRQRVGLAQALIHDPEVLILDEPTSGLDPNQIIDIRNLISEIGREKTVMLSTHIMQEVEAICDRAIIINHGKIVADDKTANLLKGLTNVKVLTVEFDKPANIKKILTVDGIESAEKLSGNSYVLKSTSGSDIRQTIFKFAVDNGLAVLTMNMQEQKLEEVFRSLTKG